MKLTRSEILKHSSDNGGWNKEQFEILGVKWPPQKGWMWSACTKEITPLQFERFKALRGANTKRLKRAVQNGELF